MAISQKGTEVEVGIGGLTYTGLIVESAGVEATGEIEWIQDEDNEPTTALISGLGKRCTIEGIVLATGFTQPDVGDVVTVDGASMLVEKSDLKRERKAAKFSLTVYKPDAITLS